MKTECMRRIEDEDEEKEEDDEKIAKNSGDLDKDDGEEEDEDNLGKRKWKVLMWALLQGS